MGNECDLGETMTITPLRSITEALHKIPTPKQQSNARASVDL